jgi:histidinol phosphatase-like PHP family hydrolase
MAKEINLQLVFGSDAHRPEDVAGHFSEILSRLP